MCRETFDKWHVDRMCLRPGMGNWRWRTCPAARLLCESQIPRLVVAVLSFTDGGAALVPTVEYLDRCLVPQSSTYLNQRC